MTTRYEAENNVEQRREKLRGILRDQSTALMLGGIMATPTRP